MQPPKTFPAKLTLLLYHRFKFFKAARDKGFIILPCELIENNASELKSAIKKYCELWKLEAAFAEWIETSNTFCNTLVDRIVPGFNAESAKEILDTKAIEDKLCVDAEQFHLWVIEGPEWIKKEFPTDKAGLNVIFANDIKPYRSRKVRLLNGPHTLMTPVAYLAGIEFVKEAVEHTVIGKFILDTIKYEITPTINLPEKELNDFASEVLNRFKNPFVKHSLLSISLNSISKFKSRLLPSLKVYAELKNKLPERIVLSMASLFVFYSGKNAGKIIPVNDDAEILAFFKTLWENFDKGTTSAKEIVTQTLANKAFWGEDLSKIPGLEERTTFYMEIILKSGVYAALEQLKAN